jgi:spermidine/putrescine transport system ATP-binding protein
VNISAEIQLTVVEQNLVRSRHDDRWSDGDSVEIGWKPEHVVVIG